MDCSRNKQRIDATLDSIGLKDGQLMLMRDFEKLLPTLDAIALRLGISGNLVEYTAVGLDEFTRLKVNYPPDDVEQTSNNKRRFETLLKNDLEAAVNNKKVNLKTYFEEAGNIMRKLSSKGFEHKISHLPYDIRQDLKNLRNYLSSTSDANIVEGVTAYIAEASVVANRIKEYLDGLDKTDKDFLVFMELNLLAQEFYPLINEMYQGLRKGYLHDVLATTRNDIERIRQLYIERANEYGMESLMVQLSPGISQMKAQFDAELARYDGLIKNSSSKLRPALEKKRQEIIDQYEKEKITEDKVQNILLGREEDLSRYINMVRATHAIPDLVIGSAVEKVKEIYADVNRNFQERRNQAGEEYKKLQMGAVHDVQGFGERLSDVMIKYTAENGVLTETQVPVLLQEYDVEYHSVMSLIRSLEELSNDGIEWSELQKYPAVQKYAKDYSSVKEFRKTYEYENSVLPYTDEFYQVDSMLDTEFEIDGDKVTLRELRDQSYRDLNMLQRDIRMNGNVVTEEHLSEFSRIEKIRRAFWKPDGKDPVWIEINKVWTEYQKQRGRFTRYEVTEESRRSFENAKKYQKKLSEELGDPTVYDNWIALNTETTTTPAFQQKITTLRANISDKRNRLLVMAGKERKDNGWDRLIELTRPYYQDGEKVASEMTPEELKEANQLYKELMEEDHSNPALFDFTDANWADYKKLKKDLYEAKKSNKKSKIIAAKEALDLYVSVNGRQVSAAEKLLYESLKTDIQAYGDLQYSTTTNDYYEAYYKAKNEFVQTRSESSTIPTSFKSGLHTFYYQDGKFYHTERSTVEITQAQYEQAWANKFSKEFESSEWFLENHIEKLKYNEKTKKYRTVMEPTYVWVKKVPTDKKDILEQEPTGSWKKTIIDERVRNPNYDVDILGMPMPSAKYKATRQNKKYIDLSSQEKQYLNYIQTNYFEDQKTYGKGQALGIQLPGIEKDTSVVDTIYSMKRLGSKATAKRLVKQAGREIFTDAQDYDESFGQINREFLPVYYSSDVPVDLQDFNFHKIFLRYAGASMNHKALKANALPFVRAVEDVMDREGVSSRTIADQTGVSIRKQENVRLALYREAMDMLVYGQHEFKSQGYDIPDTVPVIGGKNVRWEKVFNTLLSFRAKALMAFSLLPQIPNYLNIIYNSLIETAGEKGITNFNFKEFKKAWKEVHTTDIGNYLRDMSNPGNKSFFTQALEFFDAIPGELMDNAGYEIEDNKIRSLLSSDIFYLIKNSVEFFGGAVVFKATAYNYIVDGKSILDHFHIHKGKFELKPDSTLTPEQINDFTHKVRKAVWDINGNYAKIDKSLAERHWLMRSAFFMKKFVVPFIERRYSKRRWSQASNSYIEGFHLAGGKSLWKMLAMSIDNFKLANSPQFLSSYAALTDQERDALRKFTAEMGMFLILSVMASMVWDEDDEDRFEDLEEMSSIAQIGVAGLLKTRKEVETFILPFSASEMINMGQRSLQEIFPVVTQVLNMAKHIDADSPYFLERYDRDEGQFEEGDPKIYADFAKLIGNMDTKFSPEASIKATERLQQ